jgi:hypothetical protein
MLSNDVRGIVERAKKHEERERFRKYLMLCDARGTTKLVSLSGER